jgi:RNA polymerase sigma-70 factor (ECF subfamily)
MDEKRRRFEAQALPHLDAAYNLARWLARSPADADDVVQDAMLRAFRAFDGFRGEEPKAWLLAIVRNCHLTAASQRRRRSHQPLPDDDDSGPDSAAMLDPMPDPERAAIRTDESRKLDTVLWELADEYREILVLRELEDMSYREIAAIIGAPIGTVMSRLARARAALKEKWMHTIEGACDGMR